VPAFDGSLAPAPGDDPELDAVTEAIDMLDPDGSRFADVLRDTYDQLYDGQRTGRFRWDELHKTEKTYMGTIVEINVHREFDFDDGDAMDYRIANVEVDCKYSQRLGGWEFPPEAYENRHICLVIWASDNESRWEAGLIRVDGGSSILGRENRDRKRKLIGDGLQHVRPLYDSPNLPENLLLHIDDATRDAILNPPGSRREPSGQAKVNQLFRSVRERLVNRASVLTVAEQKDSMKRPRDARLKKHLGKEGILVLGHQEQDPLVAEALGLPRPPKGSFISVRVVPAEAAFPGRTAEIDGQHWRVAQSDDRVVEAPPMRGPRADPYESS
jgi:hypothetical protein